MHTVCRRLLEGGAADRVHGLRVDQGNRTLKPRPFVFCRSDPRKNRCFRRDADPATARLLEHVAQAPVGLADLFHDKFQAGSDVVR